MVTEEGTNTPVKILDSAEERSPFHSLQDCRRLKTEVAATPEELIVRMLIFWVGQIGTLIAGLFAFLKNERSTFTCHRALYQYKAHRYKKKTSNLRDFVP